MGGIVPKVSFLELGLTAETKAKPNCRRDTKFLPPLFVRIKQIDSPYSPAAQKNLTFSTALSRSAKRFCV
jgi:hypothetical protein